MKDKLHIFTLLALLIFTSCEYELEDIEIKNIDKSTDVKIKSVDLNSVPDTVYLFNPTTFSYSIDISGAQEYIVLIKIKDSYSLIGENALEGEFTINPEIYPSGVHDFTLQVRAKSGTNSLADILDKEKIFYEKSWVIVFDNAPPTKMMIKKPFNHDGALRIEWNKNKRINFKDYYITVRYDDIYDCVKHYIITDRNHNFLELTEYQGEKISIEGIIRIKNYDHYHNPDNYSYTNDVIGKTTFNSGIVSFDTIFLKGEEYTFCWNKTDYPKYFQKYLFKYQYTHELYSFFHETSDIQDTCFSTSNWHFGVNTEVGIQSVAQDQCESSFTKQMYLGEVWKPFLFLYTNPELSDLYYFLEDKIYDPQDRWVGINANFTGRGYYDRDFAIDFNKENLYVGLENGVYELDKISLNKFLILSINDFENAYISAVSVSDNDRLLFLLNDNSVFTYDKDDIISYNLKTAVIEDTIITQFNGDLKNLTVNKDGSFAIWAYLDHVNYIIKGSRIENGKFGEIQIFDGENPAFNPLNHQELYTFFTNGFFKYNLQTLEFDQVHVNNDILSPSVDPLTGYLGWVSSDSYYHVYDPIINKFIASKKLHNYVVGKLDISNFYLVDGKLYYSEGFVYDFNLE